MGSAAPSPISHIPVILFLGSRQYVLTHITHKVRTSDPHYMHIGTHSMHANTLHAHGYTTIVYAVIIIINYAQLAFNSN